MSILSKFIFTDDYVVILNKNNEVKGLSKVKTIVGNVILLNNGNKYNENTLVNRDNEDEVILPYYSLCAYISLNKWLKKNKPKGLKGKLFIKIMKLISFNMTFEECAKLGYNRNTLTPMIYNITPSELEQVISKEAADLYIGEYYNDN